MEYMLAPKVYMKSVIYQCLDYIFGRMENLPNIFDFHNSPMCYKLEVGNLKVWGKTTQWNSSRKPTKWDMRLCNSLPEITKLKPWISILRTVLAKIYAKHGEYTSTISDLSILRSCI